MIKITQAVRWFVFTAMFGGLGCAASSLDAVEAHQDDIASARQTASSTNCTPISVSDTPQNLIQNAGVCGTTSETVKDSIGRPLITIVTTRTCEPLTEEETRIYCDDESDCYVAHVVNVRSVIYPYDGCSSQNDPGEDEGGESSHDDPPSDNHDDPGYERTDGCGFDQYGRWVCY